MTPFKLIAVVIMGNVAISYFVLLYIDKSRSRYVYPIASVTMFLGYCLGAYVVARF